MDEMKIKNEILEKIKKGLFEEASQFDECDTDKIIKQIYEESFDQQNLTFYCFAIFMYKRTNNIDWLELAVDILCFSINWMEGAYAMALYHQKEILKQNRNVENIQMMLYSYRVPNVDLEEVEAVKIAKEILELDPQNKIVRDIFPNL